MPDKTVYINFFDAINPTTVNRFINFTVQAIDQHNPTELYYFISSGGGDVDSGFVLYNFLISLQSKVKITMHNIGNIDSIANVIFVAGQNRYAAQNAAFLYHGIVINFNAAGYGRSTLSENLSRLDSMETRMAETISKHTELNIGELISLFQNGESKSVTFALEKKIISEIKQPAIPAGSVHLAIGSG